uniref:Arthropsin protein n=1 Tax=Ladona fulva TaxID=123851 RepID=A0A0C9LGA4_LADFU|nr:TPA: opsin, arthropsin type [Ladona fulva]
MTGQEGTFSVDAAINSSSKLEDSAPGLEDNNQSTTEVSLNVWVGNWLGEEGTHDLEWTRSLVPSHPHWLQYPPLNPEIHYLLGSLLVLIGTTGVLGNGLVLFVFTRFRRLRGPASSFIVNLAVADLCNSLLHSMAAISSFRRIWSFGRTGCVLYACGVGYFGLLSIVTLAAIAVERYMVITAKPLSGNWKMTQYGARKVCVVIWFYCALMSAPPLLGWSRYIAEGFLTSCSWDYLTRTPANRAYYIYLLTLGFVAPVCVIAYCYAFILAAIRAHGKEMAAVKGMMSGGSPPSMGSNFSGCCTVNCRSHYHCHTSMNSHHHHSLLHQHQHRHMTTHSAKSAGHHTYSRTGSHRSCARSSNAIRTAEIILTLVLLFLTSWTPYSVVSLIGQFGDIQRVTPWTATLPAIFAKASVIYNPIVYGLSHPHFRSSVRQYLSACTTGASAGHGTTASLMRKQSPQMPVKKKTPPVTATAVGSAEVSVPSASAAMAQGRDSDGTSENVRRMAMLRSKHRRHRKHPSESPTSNSNHRLHHVHFRYASGEFLSEPDHHQHVTLLLEQSKGNGGMEWHPNGDLVSKEEERRMVSDVEGGERRKLDDKDHLRMPSCSKAVCVMYDGSHVCYPVGKEFPPSGMLTSVKSSESLDTNKGRWEMNSLL